MAPRSEDPMLITRAITFELVQPICPPYIKSQTYGRTDGRTTYDSNTALALRASRSKNLPYFSFGNLATLVTLLIHKLTHGNLSLFGLLITSLVASMKLLYIKPGY